MRSFIEKAKFTGEVVALCAAGIVAYNMTTVLWIASGHYAEFTFLNFPLKLIGDLLY